MPGDSKASITAPAAAFGRGGRGGGGGGGGARGGAASATPRTTDFEYTKDWSVNAGGRGAPPLEALDVTGNLVFAGNGYVINKTKINPVRRSRREGQDYRRRWTARRTRRATGRRAVRAAGVAALVRGADTAAAPAAADAAPAPATGPGAPPNPLGEACTDFLTPEQYGAKNGALAVVTIANFQQFRAMANPNAAGAFGGFGGGGGGGRGGLNGPNFQVPKLQSPAGLPPWSPRSPRASSLTNAIFQGEKQNAQQIFYAAGSNAKQDSFELTAAKKLNLKVAVNSETRPRRERDRHPGRRRPGAEERVCGDQRAPGSHRPGRAAARRPQRQQRSGRRWLRLHRPARHRARLRGRRGQGNAPEAQHHLPVDGRRREGALGLAVHRRIPLPSTSPKWWRI